MKIVECGGLPFTRDGGKSRRRKRNRKENGKKREQEKQLNHDSQIRKKKKKKIIDCKTWDTKNHVVWSQPECIHQNTGQFACREIADELDQMDRIMHH